MAHPMNAYPQTLLNTLPQNGYVVAMTDYEGLGTTDRTHPYLLGPSEAYAILDIVRAAQRLFGPQISSQVAIVGHSQGGQGALFAGAYAPSWAPDLTLNGVAAIAPANTPCPCSRLARHWPAPTRASRSPRCSCAAPSPPTPRSTPSRS